MRRLHHQGRISTAAGAGDVVGAGGQLLPGARSAATAASNRIGARYSLEIISSRCCNGFPL